MSSNLLKAMKNLRQNLHNVGNLNNWKKKSLNQGAIALSNMDNFTLVQVSFNAAGERVVDHIGAIGTKGWLVATPEEYMQEYETISSFYNGTGEKVRIVKMTPGMRFECSNIILEHQDTTLHPIKNGALAYYYHVEKKFVICNENPGGGAGYPLAGNKLVVVDANCTSIDGQQVYRFEVTQ